MSMPSDMTVQNILAMSSDVKAGIDAITTSLVYVCHNDVNGWHADRSFNKEEAQEVLDYIDTMMKERSVPKKEISLEYSIELFTRYLTISHHMQADLRTGKLQSERSKQFIRTSQEILNYLEDLKESAA